MTTRTWNRAAIAAPLRCLVPLLITLPTTADIITVCPDGSCDAVSLADAVAIASSGDEIQLSADTHTVSSEIVLDGISLTITGADPGEDGPRTIVSGEDATRVLDLRGGATVEIRNLAGVNGRALPDAKGDRGDDPRASWGGWMRIEDGTATVVDCVFSNNQAGTGAVIAIHVGHLETTGCRFEGNHASASGGALNHWGPCTFLCRDCDFVDNVAEYFGGAIIASQTGDSSIIGCRFERNRAGDVGDGSGEPGTAHGGGGAVALDRHPVSIDMCTFHANLGGVWGGAVYSWSREPITNSTFIGNVALAGGAIAGPPSFPSMPDQRWSIVDCDFDSNAGLRYGGAVSVTALDHLDVRNCTFQGQTSERGTTIWAGGNRGGTLDITGSSFESCCVIEPGHKIRDLGENTWGDVTFATCPECRSDLSCSGETDATDLSMLLAGWGSTSPTLDLDGDGTVGPSDLPILFAAWGGCD
jgi:hypothetical protein